MAQELPYEELDLHFPVIDHTTGRVRRLLQDAGHSLIMDTDGWYAWGENPGVAGNDEMTLHGIVRHVSFVHLMRVVKYLKVHTDIEEFVVTSSAVWSAQVAQTDEIDRFLNEVHFI